MSDINLYNSQYFNQLQGAARWNTYGTTIEAMSSALGCVPSGKQEKSDSVANPILLLEDV